MRSVRCRVNSHSSGGEEVCSHQGAPEQFWWVWRNKGGRGRQNRLTRWRTLGLKQDKQEKRHVGKPQNGSERKSQAFHSQQESKASSQLRHLAKQSTTFDHSATKMCLISTVTLSFFHFFRNFCKYDGIITIL